MLKIFIPEQYTNNNLVEITYIDQSQESTTREMDITELNSWIQDSKTNKEIIIEIEDSLTINQISLEEYNNEYDVILNTYTYSSTGNKLESDYKDKHLKTYKNKKRARTFAQKQVKVNNAIDIISEYAE
jgi:hypothetical protein